MRQFLGMIQLVVSIAMMGLIGQGILYILAGENREKNIFYQVLRDRSVAVREAVPSDHTAGRSRTA